MRRRDWPRVGAALVALLALVVIVAIACEGPTGPAGVAGTSDPALEARVAALEAALANLEVRKNLVLETTSTSNSADTLTIHADALSVQGVVLSPLNLTVPAAGTAVDTWYSVSVATSAGGLVLPAAFLTAKGATPNPPAGHPLTRRVGWIHTPSIAGIAAFRWIRQTDRFVHYAAKAAAGEPSISVDRFLVNGRGGAGNLPLFEVTGTGGPNQETAPGEWFPPGVREVLVKSLINLGVNGNGAPVISDAYWNADGPSGTVPADSLGHRRLCRASVGASGTGDNSASETDTWVTLNTAGTFYAGIFNPGGSAFLSVLAEGYLDESL